MVETVPEDLRQVPVGMAHNEDESVGYEGLLVEDIEDVINILLDHASIIPHKEFVLQLGQRLCPSQLRPHRVVTDRGVEFVADHVLDGLHHDCVIVDEHFLGCLKGSIWCCEQALTLGPDWVNETPVQDMIEVLRRVVTAAGELYFHCVLRT
jgi:hypothetical protein